MMKESRNLVRFETYDLEMTWDEMKQMLEYLQGNPLGYVIRVYIKPKSDVDIVVFEA